ncbi:cell division protein FtsA [Pontiella sulfatireligans]|uniref:Cell division protein FtsA n=1 Tax=Pontiella sulfatireligans TaxID=2750658 RepID=A0A6C2UX29_9BACT|nr:cell division protein FtsA [Pontiella sulfatireligans]VGO23406.1 Cell division protein FtsA [Pontiella sulfatireligans]
MAIETTAVLDIGTGTVRVMVGELRDDGIVSVIGIGEAESRGIRKGEIINRDHAIGSVRAALKAAEDNRRKRIHSIMLVTSGGQAVSKTSTGIHKLVDPEYNQLTEIVDEDVAEVIEVARKVALPETRIKLHTLQQYFQVDDMVNVTSPIGMAGEELMVDMLTIHGKRSTVDNFRKMVDDVPIECTDAVFSGLCAGMAVVSKEQKNAGVLVIDIGSGTTDFVLYNEGFIHAAGSFAVGGDHVTNDIAVGLQIPANQAEEIKVKDGSALTNLMERDHNIPLPASQGFSGRMVRAVTLNTIINARMDEIFTLVKEHIERHCPNVPLSAGVLLTGGGAFMNGARDLGQKVFNAPCAHGKPFDVQGLPSAKSGPLYATHIGCIRYAASLRKVEEERGFRQRLLHALWGGSHE